MRQKIYQVDAFSSRVFEGNPAAVCILKDWLSDSVMQNIAQENNLAETAFLVALDTETYHLRWFTPTIEVDLCGHATLASAHIIFTQTEFIADHVNFQTRSGKLSVERLSAGKYAMDFPADFPETVIDFSEIASITGVKVKACYRGKDDYLVIVASEEEVFTAKPDFKMFHLIKSRGIIISAVGTTKDFVSRCFFPNAGIDEDPVTGSAHTLMTPYWSKEIGKSHLLAAQISKRGGDLECILKGDRVSILGNAVTYLVGEILI